MTPQPVSPFSSSVINFQRSIGYAAGATVWGNPERIALTNGNVVWTQNVGLLSQTSKILTHNVPTYLQGEVANLRLTYRDYGSDSRDDLGFRIARYAE